MVANLKQRYPNLYPCLEVKVKHAGQWTVEDVYLNQGIIWQESDQDPPGTPREIRELRTKLCAKRSFNVSRFPFP